MQRSKLRAGRRAARQTVRGPTLIALGLAQEPKLDTEETISVLLLIENPSVTTPRNYQSFGIVRINIRQSFAE